MGVQGEGVGALSPVAAGWSQQSQGAPGWAARSPSFLEFRAFGVGNRALIRVIPGSITYEKRYANWLTWILVIFTCGFAAFAWPLILFGRGSVTIPET